MKNSFERVVDISQLDAKNIMEFSVPQLVTWILKYYKNDPLGALISLQTNNEISNVNFIQAKILLEGAVYAKTK